MSKALPPNLPNFFIIGAAKCGTSSLFANITQHPQVYKPFRKELHFFDKNDYYANGLDWYLNLYFKGAEKYQAIGEATPAYIYWAEVVAPRMADVYQGSSPKFIAIFRDPVERAYSRYWHDLRQSQPLLFENGTPVSFEKALELEKKLVETDTFPKVGTGYSFVRGGLYAPKIKIFQQWFPRENFLFILNEDLKHNPEGTFASIFKFLGIDDLYKTGSIIKNQAATPTNRKLYQFVKEKSFIKELIKPFLSPAFRFGLKRRLANSLLKPLAVSPINPDTEKTLRAEFQDSIFELEDLLGWDLTAWHSGPGK